MEKKKISRYIDEQRFKDYYKRAMHKYIDDFTDKCIADNVPYEKIVDWTIDETLTCSVFCLILSNIMFGGNDNDR